MFRSVVLHINEVTLWLHAIDEPLSKFVAKYMKVPKDNDKGN
jgi:hypothetical protein